MYIFAYGSNMHVGRLLRRAPSATPVTTAYIRGYRWLCHKVSQDGSSKANMLYTGIKDDITWGAIYDIRGLDKIALDNVEGLGNGYDEDYLEFTTADGQILRAQVYIANNAYIDDNLLPYEWYRQFALQGAWQHALPSDYVRYLEKTCSKTDPDMVRREVNFEILNSTIT